MDRRRRHGLVTARNGVAAAHNIREPTVRNYGKLTSIKGSARSLLKSRGGELHVRPVPGVIELLARLRGFGIALLGG